MAPPSDDEHSCGWKAYAEHLATELAAQKKRLDELEQRFLKKSERRRKSSKLPPPVQRSVPESERQQTRKRNAEQMASKLETDTEHIPVPPKHARCCGACGSTDMSRLGAGKPSVRIEFVAAHFRKRVFLRETLICHNGHITTAPAPRRMGEKTQYAPSFVAHLVTSRCRDSMPHARLASAYQSIGLPISRSTITALFHRAAKELKPLHDCALQLVKCAPDVHADETSIRQQGQTKRSFVWTFVTNDLTVYRYATTRSGDVPAKVLGDSQGRLVVDQYTGYNQVTATGRRTRAGCLAHARRKLFEQQEHPEVAEALDLIGEIYAVEHRVRDAGTLGSESHLAARQRESRPLFARLLCWARRQRGRHDPRSKMGAAIRYILKYHRELGCFLRFASIPPDNNKAEAALRRIALSRVNSLFVGNEKAGHNLAVLQTLVMSCHQHGHDPVEYLGDVLIRVQTHPAKRIEELLPHRWTPPES